MIRPGLVSISFRKLLPAEIVALAVEAGLEGIEWGGDVHVPHGDEAAARQAARMTREAGLEVAAYGSYYRAAESEAQGLAFEAVLSSAKLLGAPTVRVWAGTKGSLNAGEADREAVVSDLLRISEMAAREAITVSLEYHTGTLTDTPESTVALLQTCAHPNLKAYWQPRVGVPVEESTGEIVALLPWLTHLHVYHWHSEPRDRRPLEEGRDAWNAYFRQVKAAGASDRFAMLEFVRDDAPGQCVEDARVLKELVAKANS